MAFDRLEVRDLETIEMSLKGLFGMGAIERLMQRRTKRIIIHQVSTLEECHIGIHIDNGTIETCSTKGPMASLPNSTSTSTIISTSALQEGSSL